MDNRLKPLKFVKDIRDKQSEVGYTIEMMANTILNGVGIEQAPVDVEIIAKIIGFKTYTTSTFKQDSFSAFICDREKIVKNFDSGSLIVVRKADSIEVKRFWQSVCICQYILNANENEDFNQTFSYNDVNDEKEYVLARAILMPQKELAMYINSPLLRSVKGTELTKNIANSFLVPESIVQLRLIEAGLEI
jgi:hypothetical protein